MPHIRRNTHFNPERNMTTVCGMTMCGYMYDEELAGPDGMHYHVWVPAGTTMEELRDIYRCIQNRQDIVSMSFDYLEADDAAQRS